MLELYQIYSKAVYTGGNDILTLVESNKNFEKEVKEIEKRYLKIDISRAMTNFRNIERVLLLAYVGSKDFPCSAEVKNMITNYQTLITNSSKSIDSFVDLSIMAITQHKKAIRLMFEKKNRPEKNISSALSLITKSSDIAGKMEVETQELFDSVSHFIEMTKTSLASAMKDEDINTHKYLKSMYSLGSDSRESDGLVASIVTLNLTIEALKKLQIILENVKQYCCCMKAHCVSLKVNSRSMNLYSDDPEELLEEIYKSGISWLALGKINQTANEAIQKINVKIQQIRNQLIAKSEALSLIKEETQAIINSLIQ